MREERSALPYNLGVGRWLTERAKDAELHDRWIVRALVTVAAAKYHRDKGMAQRLAEAFRRLALPRLVADEALRTPRGLPHGPVPMGSTALGGRALGLPHFRELPGNVIVVGVPGSVDLEALTKQ